MDVTGEADFDGTTFVGLGTNVGVGTDSGDQNYGLTVKNGISADNIVISGGNINVQSGIVTANKFVGTINNLSSGEGIQITYEESPNKIVFNVAGIGSTSFLLL